MLGMAPAPPLRVAFDRPDGLITNEFALYSRGGRRSQTWIATSGSLFARGGQGWTGRPDAVSPDRCSCRSTDSAVFRLVTRRRNFGDVAVSFRLTNRRMVSTRRTPRREFDGVHVFLRYRSPQELYVLSVNRRDGKVAIKKKVPGGRSNGGRYVQLGPTASWRWQRDVPQAVRVAVETVGPQRVLLTLSVDGRQLLQAADDGPNGPPLLRPGRVGLRGDNDEFVFDDFAARPL